MEVRGKLHAEGALPPGERNSGTDWVGGMMAPEPMWMLNLLFVPRIEPRFLGGPVPSVVTLTSSEMFA
jgi:hypothetical protein